MERDRNQAHSRRAPRHKPFSNVIEPKNTKKNLKQSLHAKEKSFSSFFFLCRSSPSTTASGASMQATRTLSRKKRSLASLARASSKMRLRATTHASLRMDKQVYLLYLSIYSFRCSAFFFFFGFFILISSSRLWQDIHDDGQRQRSRPDSAPLRRYFQQVNLFIL